MSWRRKTRKSNVNHTRRSCKNHRISARQRAAVLHPLIVEYLKKRQEYRCLSSRTARNNWRKCGTFKPVREWYPPNWVEERAKKYFNDAYSDRKDLGNYGGGSGYIYRGAGFIQLTGKGNFEKYGKKIGVDLVANPDLALDDHNSVALLVEYALNHGLDVWAQRASNPSDEFPEELCWRKVRKLVNGGYTHYDKFHKFVTAFKEAAKS